MSWKEKLSKGIEDVKTKVEASRQKSTRLKDIEEQAYYAAKEKQAAKIGAARANIEAKGRIKSFKTGGGAPSILGGSFNPNGSLLGSGSGMSSMLYGPEQPKKRQKRRKKAKYKMVRVRV